MPLHLGLLLQWWNQFHFLRCDVNIYSQLVLNPRLNPFFLLPLISYPRSRKSRSHLARCYYNVVENLFLFAGHRCLLLVEHLSTPVNFFILSVSIASASFAYLRSLYPKFGLRILSLSMCTRLSFLIKYLKTHSAFLTRSNGLRMIFVQARKSYILWCFLNDPKYWKKRSPCKWKLDTTKKNRFHWFIKKQLFKKQKFNVLLLKNRGNIDWDIRKNNWKTLQIITRILKIT